MRFAIYLITQATLEFHLRMLHYCLRLFFHVYKELLRVSRNLVHMLGYCIIFDYCKTVPSEKRVLQELDGRRCRKNDVRVMTNDIIGKIVGEGRPIGICDDIIQPALALDRSEKEGKKSIR